MKPRQVIHNDGSVAYAASARVHVGAFRPVIKEHICVDVLNNGANKRQFDLVFWPISEIAEAGSKAQEIIDSIEAKVPANYTEEG